MADSKLNRGINRSSSLYWVMKVSSVCSSVCLTLWNSMFDLLTGLEGMDSMTGSFISDLVIGYIISGIATVAIGISMLKKDR